MTSIQYDDIFNSFLGEITDFDIAALAESDADEQMTEWLHKAVYNPHITDLFSSISLDDDIHIITYEMRTARDDVVDMGFVINLLGKAMAYEWVSPQVNRTTNLHQMFSNSDAKFYAQANHLSQLRELRDDLESEFKSLVDNRSLHHNEYLEG